jgi:hypothetical protein
MWTWIVSSRPPAWITSPSGVPGGMIGPRLDSCGRLRPGNSMILALPRRTLPRRCRQAACHPSRRASMAAFGAAPYRTSSGRRGTLTSATGSPRERVTTRRRAGFFAMHRVPGVPEPRGEAGQALRRARHRDRRRAEIVEEEIVLVESAPGGAFSSGEVIDWGSSGA